VRFVGGPGEDRAAQIWRSPISTHHAAVTTARMSPASIRLDQCDPMDS